MTLNSVLPWSQTSRICSCLCFFGEMTGVLKFSQDLFYRRIQLQPCPCVNCKWRLYKAVSSQLMLETSKLCSSWSGSSLRSFLVILLTRKFWKLMSCTEVAYWTMLRHWVKQRCMLSLMWQSYTDETKSRLQRNTISIRKIFARWISLRPWRKFPAGPSATSHK